MSTLNRSFVPHLLTLTVTTVLITSCGQTSSAPPASAIVSPASGSSVSGTVAVQISVKDSDQVVKVQVYARAPGSTATGVLLGSAATEPFVVSVQTGQLPNASDLELYAVATGPGGSGPSDPVRVRVANAGAPELRYLVAYTLPHSGTAAPQALKLQPQSVRAPQGLQTLSAPIHAQAAGDRSFAAEWAWNTIDGSSGYRVYLGKADTAGPYEQVYAQTPGTAAIQRYSQNVAGARVGDRLYGTVSALTGNALAEGARSNADDAQFLGTQEAASPGDGQSVHGGRPTLTWSALGGAGGYLYRIYDKSPLDSSAKEVWSNGNTVVTSQSAAYPAKAAALPAGTYYWWVAGVRFDAAGNSDAFSYSDPRSFVVP